MSPYGFTACEPPDTKLASVPSCHLIKSLPEEGLAYPCCTVGMGAEGAVPGAGRFLGFEAIGCWYMGVVDCYRPLIVRRIFLGGRSARPLATSLQPRFEMRSLTVIRMADWQATNDGALVLTGDTWDVPKADGRSMNDVFRGVARWKRG